MKTQLCQAAMHFGVIFTHSPYLVLQESSWQEKKIFFREWHQMSPTYWHVAKLFLESEFQHRGNKEMKKCKFSARSCGFLGKNRFWKTNYLNTTQKRTEKFFWTKLSSLAQEPTFKLRSTTWEWCTTCMFLTSDGGRVVQWCWVTCDTGASYYTWLTVGQGSTVLSVCAGRIVWIIFLSSIISLSFSLSLGIGPILTEILSHWATKSYNH